MVATAYLGLGSNQGDRLAHLQTAVRKLNTHPHVREMRTSPVYETAAHTWREDEDLPDYLNAVVGIQTQLSPKELLALAQQLETEAGRSRTDEDSPWRPRPLDVDILVYGNQQYQTEALTVPHPRLAERRFVLEPLADLNADLLVPAPFKASVTRLLQECPDSSKIRKTSFRLSV